MSWEATCQREMRSKGHFISHKEYVEDVANISLNFSIMFYFFLTVVVTPPLGIGILCMSGYLNCKVFNESLGYKIDIVSLKQGSNG